MFHLREDKTQRAVHFSVSVQPGRESWAGGGGHPRPDLWLEDRGHGQAPGRPQRLPGRRLPGGGGLAQGQTGN